MLVYGTVSRQFGESFVTEQCTTHDDDDDDDGRQIAASTPVRLQPRNSPSSASEESSVDDGARQNTRDLSFTTTSCGYSSQMDNTLSDVDHPNSQSAHVHRKFLVFESSLDELFRHCPECGKPVIATSKHDQGTCVIVTAICLEGHSHKWHSQPMTGNMSAGNLLVSASVLFSGSTMHRFAAMADILKLQSLSESEFYRIQDACLFPIIQKAYDRHIDTVNAWLGDAPLLLIGDGRCDSPGHLAKYGTYTLMDQNTGVILDFQQVQVSEVANSYQMEKEGLHRAIQKVQSEGFTIAVLATDRHSQVTKYMKEEHPQIDHQYDVWHLAKSVVKKLTEKAKPKKC